MLHLEPSNYIDISKIPSFDGQTVLQNINQFIYYILSICKKPDET